MLIARGHVDLDNEAVIARCYEFLNEHKLQDISNRFGRLDGRLSSIAMAMYLIKNNLRHLMPHNWPELQPLVEAIKQQAGGENIKISWFNVLPAGTGLAGHNHLTSVRDLGSKYASFVYYPHSLESEMIPLQLLVDNKWQPVSVVQGDWVCFGLDCTHQVLTNMSAQHRITFAFDV